MTGLVSLVVCTLDRTEPLVRLLRTLRCQRYKNFEVIVVDQNPRGYLDETLKEGEGLRLKVINSLKGLSRARNKGLQACRGEIVGFPDDDCWYREDTLENTVCIFRRDAGIHFIAGRTVDENGGNTVSRFLSRNARITRWNAFLAGNSASIFVKLAALRALGGFDESLGVGADSPFQSAEERDLILRCLASGYRGLFDHSLIVYHQQIKVTLSRQRAYSLGYGRVLKMHSFGRSYLAARMARSAMGGVYRLVRGDVEGAKQRLVWGIGTFKGYRML